MKFNVKFKIFLILLGYATASVLLYLIRPSWPMIAFHAVGIGVALLVFTTMRIGEQSKIEPGNRKKLLYLVLPISWLLLAFSINSLYEEYLWTQAGSGDCQRLILRLEKQASVEANNVDILNNYAWVLLTCPNEVQRNYQEAFRLVDTMTVELRADKSKATSSRMDTVMCAYAARGDFEAASKMAVAVKNSKREIQFKNNQKCAWN